MADDVDGIERSITRLDTHFNHFTTTISDTGYKEIRLDIKENVISDLNLSYMTRKSKLEDADMIKAISELQARETAYQAALASSARVMQLSLMDYL
jgi:flagellar hook-associated protein 3 FlgL